MCGESYGTLRAAGLSDHLRDRYYMELNGIVLISSVLDFQTLDFSDTNELPAILFLPTYTATAWYHKRLGKKLQNRKLEDLLDEVKQFAIHEYTPALMQGTSMDPKTRERVAAKLSKYTGLSQDFVERANLRISMSQFAKELMRDEDRTVGRFDGRYTGQDRDGVGERYEYDPSAAAIFGPYAAAMYDYTRNKLQVKREDVYEILTSKVHPWNYKTFQNRYVSSSSSLRSAMTENPYLKVFVGNGYYDLATPYFATEYTFNTMDLTPATLDNLTMKYYRAGHMFYVHEPSLKKLHGDLVKFYKNATGAKPKKK